MATATATATAMVMVQELAQVMVWKRVMVQPRQAFRTAADRQAVKPEQIPEATLQKRPAAARMAADRMGTGAGAGEIPAMHSAQRQQARRPEEEQTDFQTVVRPARQMETGRPEH
jgi:hypothetical protein